MGSAIYEVQIFDRDWKIDTVFDERPMALAEAQRMVRSNRYGRVRVVKEWLPHRGTEPRVIYASGAPPDEFDDSEAVSRRIKRKLRVSALARERRRQRRREFYALIWLIAKLGLLIGAGLWFSFWLRGLSG